MCPAKTFHRQRLDALALPGLQVQTCFSASLDIPRPSPEFSPFLFFIYF
jgi:hypothetical protein